MTIDDVPVSCPPEQWVQALADQHLARLDRPEVREDPTPRQHGPGSTHHRRTMPRRTRTDLLKLVTFNILHPTGGLGDDWDPGDPGPPPRYVSDIAKVVHWADPDLIGLQEGLEAESDIRDAFEAPDGAWTFCGYEGTGARQQNPVMLRVGRWSDIDDVQFFGAPAGSGGTPPELWGTQVTATHRASGQRVRVLNCHWQSHVDNDGVPYDLPRQDLYRQLMEKVVLRVRDTPASMLCFVMGDTNIDYRNPRSRRVTWWPPKALADVEMVCNWFYARTIPSFGTHGDSGTHSVYDQVYHRRTPQVQWASNGILHGLQSDHNAVRTSYAVTVLANGTDYRGRNPGGGSNSPSQGNDNDHSHQRNLDDNAPVDLDLIATANLCFSYSDVEHNRRIDEILGVRGAAICCLQELTARDTQPRWTTVQPNQPDSSPAGQAVLVRKDLDTPAFGSVRASSLSVAGIQARYFPWMDVKLPWLSERVRVVSVHQPPKRMPQYLKDDYRATLRAFLQTSPHPWIVGGDWNMRLVLDPCGLTQAFNARWYGSGIDGFAVHPHLARYVGGDGGRKILVGEIRPHNRDGHPLVYLRLCRIDTRQRRDLPDTQD